MIYYHFTGATLRNGEPIPPIGEWLVFGGKPVPCKCGLHASPTISAALKYASGELLHQVKLGGKIVPNGNPVDKFAARKRKIVASIDATPILQLHARRVALDVIHLWDAPPIVREYLVTGDESKRDAAAREVPWEVPWDLAEMRAASAAHAATYTRAVNASQIARRNAAWTAPWGADRDAKWKLYGQWLDEMVVAAFAKAASH